MNADKKLSTVAVSGIESPAPCAFFLQNQDTIVVERILTMATIISSQNEQLLNQVVSTGRFHNQDEALTEAVRMLYEQTLNGSSDKVFSSEEWITSFRAWSRKHRKGNLHMDDSRESIYDDRGA